jgi:DNA-binding SARP family transcriptional activator/tetratricopeptide (TPR) repeat protein
MAAPAMRARLLGRFELEVDGRPVPPADFERPPGLRLLKLLLATPGHRVRREAAADLLWPDADADQGATNLRKTMYIARRGLGGTGRSGDSIVRADLREVWLAPDQIASIDMDVLSAAILAVERSTATPDDLDDLARLGGEVLLPDDPYEEWLEPIREGLRRRSVEALLAGAARARAMADRPRAFALVARVLDLEPADERAHGLAIDLHLDAGALHAARRQLQACRRAVAEAYGVEPDLALSKRIDDARAQRAGAGAGVAEPPIIGRGPELAVVEAEIDRLDRSRASVASVLVRGAAGIGKSRLLREMVGLARAAGWPLVELRGLEDGTTRPLAAFGTALAATLGEEGVSGLAEPGRSAVHFTDAAATGPADVEFASDEAVRRGLLDAVARAGRRSEPMTIVVDDAQWLDRPTLDLLAEAMLGSAQRALLLLLAVRDEPALLAGPVSVVLAAIDQAAAGTSIVLGPLAPDEIRAFIERDVAALPLADGLATAISELSAGMPLFAADLFRSAGETGLVEQRDGRWAFRRGVTALQVPESITRLVDRRIARMGPIARVVLATAAELGDLVAFEDLVETGPGTDDVLDAVDAAIAAGLVVERDGRYAFAHPLYRAALRRGLPPRDRLTVHRRIAAALARGIDPHDAVAVARAGLRGVDILAVASHAARATELGSRDSAGLAVGFGLGAGGRRADVFDYAGAISTIQVALRIWQRLPETERGRFGVSGANIRLGQSLRRVGDDVAAGAAFDEAMATARDDNELAAAASAAAWLPYEHGRYGQSLEILNRVGSRITDAAAQALLDSMRAWVLGREGKWNAAVELLLRTIAELDTGGATPDLMRALDRLAIAYRDGTPSNAAAAIPLLERAINMAVELGRTNERATYEMHLAGAYQALHRYDDAIVTLDRARGLCHLTGEQYIETVVEWVSAEVEELRGNLAEAIAHRRRELAIFAAIGGNPRHELLAHAHIAHLARLVGDRDLERAEAEAARIGARHSGIDGLMERVEWALTTEDWFGEMPAVSAVPAANPS